MLKIGMFREFEATEKNATRPIFPLNMAIQKPLGIFKILENKDPFNEVYLDDFGVVPRDINSSVDINVGWDNKLDICPDCCYIYSKPL